MTAREFITFLEGHIKLNPSDDSVTIGVDEGGKVTGLGFGSDGMVVTHDYRPEHSNRSKWEYFQSIIQLAGFDVLAHYELANGYYPRSYTSAVLENPWWLVKTQYGLIEIGWRKRVISISWDFTKCIVTSDEVTRGEDHVHAYSNLKAAEYLQALRTHMEAQS